MHVFLQLIKLAFGLWVAASPWIAGYADIVYAVIINLAIGVSLASMAVWNLTRIAAHRPLVGEPKSVEEIAKKS